MKNLVIYFSIFGSTKQFAEMVHDKVGGEIKELKPIRPYEKEYKPLLAFSKQEVDNGILTPFEELNIDIRDYDNIFVGYPMWWYTYPPILKNFFKKYDMTGKTIIPFNTHEGSGTGGTYQMIRNDVPEAKVLDGLAIRGGSMNEKQRSNVYKWLENLGF
ncbi:MAG: NAD(P)H-dependent oxidoreductase [Bacilli bacterium]|nr:NAD(P)H-dependent oxidoreductase [Bacilli bacterium]